MSAGVHRTVYVISDLHLGGEYAEKPEGRGFRINTHVQTLAEFVNDLAGIPSDGPEIELVINGDMVDFLAEKPFEDPFTPIEACAKLQAIADRDSEFFKALHKFLDQNHRLTILTGNHDIELALPPVRQKLRELIGVKPSHDYELICNGEAYQVGDALIDHGNRYDEWNVVDHDGLRRISSLLSRRQSIPEKYPFQLATGGTFDPPAGSKMVTWMINLIKQDYKFVDLLKPETDATVALLLALEPGYRQFLATIAKAAIQARHHRLMTPAVPSFAGDISATSNSSSVVISDAIAVSGEVPSYADDEEEALMQVLKDRLGGDVSIFLDELLPVATKPWGEISATDSSLQKKVDRTKGWIRLWLARDDQDIGRRLPALLLALKALLPDHSFELDREDASEYSHAANDLFRGGFRFVLFGHTHLAKKVELQPGCWYLNSGTWADLMRLPDGIAAAVDDTAARKKLDPFVQDIGRGDLKRWIIFRPTYVQLDLDAAGRVISADLREYYKIPAPGQPSSDDAPCQTAA